MRCWRGLLATLACLATAAPASALEYSTFRMDDGRAAMLVSGPFEPWDSPAKFTTMAVRAGVEVVTFDSPGGSIDVALALGRAIRALGIDTAQARATDCASACSLAFLGGVTRTAEPGSIGVHRSYLAPESPHARDEAIVLMQQTTAAILRYLGEMGVDPELLQVSLEYGSEDMRYLSTSEMSRMRVTTDGREAPPPPQQPVAGVPSDLVAPRAEIVIAGSAVTFEWTPGEGVTARTLTIGTAGPGSHDVVRRRIGARATSYRASNLPAGAKLDVRLSSRIGDAWQHRDYRFATALPVVAEMTAPSPGTRIPTDEVEFRWSEGSGVQRYRLSLGTTGPGSSDLHAGPATRRMTRTIRALPPDHTIFVRLESRIDGRWHAADSVYATSGPPAVAHAGTPGRQAPAPAAPATDDLVVDVAKFLLFLERQRSVPAAAASARSSVPARRDDDVASFVTNLIEAHAAGPQQALAAVEGGYAATVDYFGKPFARDAVIEDKRAYFERWPQRRYEVVEDSIDTLCARTICSVTGRYRWAVRNVARNGHASGTASFEFRVDTGNGALLVTHETSAVLSRD